jgi:hypothetical protein
MDHASRTGGDPAGDEVGLITRSFLSCASGAMTLLVSGSTNGGLTFDTPTTVATLQSTNFQVLGTVIPTVPTAAVQDRGGEVAAQQVLDTDRSGGAHRGRVYLAYADTAEAETC